MSKARSSLFLSAASFFGLGVNFLALPWLIKWIGPGEWGLFIFLLTISLYVGLIDVDLSNGAIKRMTEAFHAGDDERAWRVQRCQFGAHIFMALAGCAAFVLLGLVLALPTTGGFVAHREWLMPLVGINFLINALSAAMGPPFVAGERFAEMAIRDSVQRILSLAMGIYAAYAFGTLFAYMVAWNAGALIGFAVNFITLKLSFPAFRLRPAWDKAIIKDLFVIGVRGYPHRIGSIISNSVHLPLMAYAGSTVTPTRYQLAGRIPEAIMSVLSPSISTVLPQMTREASSDPSAFARSIERYSMMSLGIGISFILVPAGFGAALLDIWARNNPALTAQAPLVMLLLGGYFTLELFYMTMTRAFHALGKPHCIAPFSLFNAATTLALTYPVVLRFGIVGVAVQNLAINGLILIPMTLAVKSWAAPELPSLRIAAKACMGLLVGAAVASAAFILMGTAALESRPWIALAMAPVFCGVAFFLLAALKLAPVPKEIASLAAQFRYRRPADADLATSREVA